MKRCRNCQRPKQLSQFKKNNRNPDGRDSICKICYNERNKGYNRTHRNTPRGAATMAWSRIRYRCGNPNGDFPAYAHVENRFTRSEFMAWAIPAYTEWLLEHGTVIGASVDRIRSIGHYEQGNVQLLTTLENTVKSHCGQTIQDIARHVATACTKHGYSLCDLIDELTKLSKNNKKPADLSVAG